jgi:hypothetical protein
MRPNLVKFIQRGDTWRAKQAVDGELKECLLRLLEWHARCVYRPGQAPGMTGTSSTVGQTRAPLRCCQLRLLRISPLT